MLIESYFELRDYIEELGYTIDCDFFIKYDGLLVLVDNDNVIFDLFNMIKDGDEINAYVSHGVNEPNQTPLELEFVPNRSESGVAPHSSSIVPPSSDPIIDHDPGDDEVKDESRSEGDTNEDSEVDTDVHQEYIDIRASKRHFKRSQGRSRGTTSNQIHVGEKGPDLGYDETNIGIRESLVGKLRRC
ncbi:hypothetical protein KY290_025976 [Solanum tuberosum]|uniref:Transposon MuDR mudrA n=1 Tax=Solanum tuberosum TaxID=4113 RepID=A0ABQ7UX51_SOLTU|nr:hypothetical protein KY289_025052 [Solanum tuberosum]KAH0673754.1 hypothetical protein KY284_024841 [Solanum tuberosum]KAH0677040.1 hypothetical protein KY285_024841 [Solanum tuberosum]KAH0755706.1 hypothetical protein KY290_025976 [Solanum tuberosum]